MLLHIRIHLIIVMGAALALPWMNPVAVSAVAVLAVAWHLVAGRQAVRGLLRGLWRLKWLLVALLLVYLWLPGSDGFSIETVLAALHRAQILMTLFAVVHTLLFTFSGATLGAALSEWLSPLDRIGLPGTDFARRLALLLSEAVNARARFSARAPEETGGWLAAVPTRLAREIERVETDARAVAQSSVEAEPAPRLGPAPGSQWALAVLSIAALVGLLAV